MSILQRLREETRPAHVALEQISGAHRIMDHSITIEQYKKLLQANYHAYAKAESHLSDKHDKKISDWVLADLQQIDPNTVKAFYPNTDSTETTQLGITYVIEGSLLGGAMIAQHIKECEDLQHLNKQQFYAAGSRERASRWKSFMQTMQSKSFTSSEQDQIVAAANQCFDWFKSEFLKR